MDNPKKILLIDDEVTIRKVIAFKLKNHGYKVVLAANGEHGLEMIRTDFMQKPFSPSKLVDCIGQYFDSQQ